MPSKCEPKTRFIPATCAWILLLGATAMFFVFPCVYLAIHYHLAIPICQGFVTFFVLANFTLATFMDPGIIPKASTEETRDDDFRVPLYKNVEINGITVRMKWCTTCRFYRPPRCSHCSVCNNCIETFDHHCPWVNNCIGRRNYRHFFLFLVSLSVHMISIFALCTIYLLDHTNDLDKPDTIVCIAIMVIIFCLIFPILGLTGFHVVLVSRGRTTNEQVTGKFRGGYNPFSRGCCKNVMYSLCGPQHPRYVGRKSKPLMSSENSAPIATIPLENQVRIYMDTSNGVRGTNPSAYCKMTQGRNISATDITLDTTQSQDCEPTPPCPRSGSKTNLFDANEMREAFASGVPRTNHVVAPSATAVRCANVTYGSGNGAAAANNNNNNQHRCSPHPRPRILGEPMRSRSGTPDPLSPQGPSRGAGSPSAVRSGSVVSPPSGRTPPALSSPVRRSSPGTPTTPRSPGFAKRRTDYGSPGSDGRPPLGYPCYPDVRESALYRQRQLQQQQYPAATNYSPQGQQLPVRDNLRSISPQRKFASESELLRAAGGESAAAHLRNSNHTADNLRDLAGSPVHVSPAVWRDQLPYYQQQQPPPPPPPSNANYYPHHRGQSPAQPPFAYPTPPRASVAGSGDFWSHPTSPTSGMVASRPPMFSSSVYGRRNSSCTSPQAKRIVFGQVPPLAAVATAVASPYPVDSHGGGPRMPMRRPMSFVKALEVTDSIEMTPTGRASHSPSEALAKPELRSGAHQQSPNQQNQEGDRKSFYDTNYEISV